MRGNSGRPEPRGECPAQVFGEQGGSQLASRSVGSVETLDFAPLSAAATDGRTARASSEQFHVNLSWRQGWSPSKAAESPAVLVDPQPHVQMM